MGNENTPAPEVLKPQDESSKSSEPESKGKDKSKSDGKSDASAKAKAPARRRGTTYRPSHKATFLGLAVVVGVLAINAGVVAFLMRSQSGEEAQSQRDEVVVSTEALEQLGVSRNPVGNLGTELIVGPDSRFNGSVTVGSDLDIGGQLTLNSKLSASDASLTNLQAGETALQSLNVNGDGTMSNLALRGNLGVAGTSTLQGQVTITNSLVVGGSVSIGGALSVQSFQVNNLTVGGKLMSRGAPPSVSRGPAAGSNGTVSISGNDTAGTVAVNAGTGAGGGILASVSFREPYSTTPHVVVTAVGRSAGSVYITRTASGFSIGVGGSLTPGGYAFDYIVVQ
jgi:hypothetical protein